MDVILTTSAAWFCIARLDQKSLPQMMQKLLWQSRPATSCSGPACCDVSIVPTSMLYSQPNFRQTEHALHQSCCKLLSPAHKPSHPSSVLSSQPTLLPSSKQMAANLLQAVQVQHAVLTSLSLPACFAVMTEPTSMLCSQPNKL